MTQPPPARHLTLVHDRRHDLPPFWDGAPVEWRGWSGTRSSNIYHATADDLACRACGAIDEALINPGMRPPETPTVMGTKIKTTKSGHRYEVPHEVKALPARDIVAARCRHCSADVVTDLRTGEVWVLDESDYTATGSTPPPGVSQPQQEPVVTHSQEDRVTQQPPPARHCADCGGPVQAGRVRCQPCIARLGRRA